MIDISNSTCWIKKDNCSSLDKNRKLKMIKSIN